MTVSEIIRRTGIVPVVVLDDAKDAVPTAKALCAGGVPVMEITFRTDAAADSIAAVSEGCPEMLVGAGTVITLEQCRLAVLKGAKFIVCPGFDDEVVKWCLDNNVPVFPGCVTTSEVSKAVKLGLKVLKFFPANIFGGLATMKALTGPFAGIKFMPTGGIGPQNIAEYAAAPYIHAVGGSWICPKADVAAGNFDRITALCKEARRLYVGFEVAHVGINCPDADAALGVCDKFAAAFDFETKLGNSSNFSSSFIEVMKSDYLGEKGHIAVRANSLDAAIAELEFRGFEVDTETAKYKNGRMIAVYLKDSFGGFAVHLLQK